MTPKIRSHPRTAVPPPGPAPEPVDQDFPELADLAFLLDSRWRIPVVGVRFGVDAVASLVPVVGDLATGVISGYIVHKAYRLGAPRRLLMQMAGNVALDVVIGSVPLVGSVFDLFYKANNVNVKLLRDHLVSRGKALPAPRPGQETQGSRQPD